MAQLFNLPLEITFASPQFLYLLILIPIFIIIYFTSMSYKNKRAINFPNFEALERTGLTEIHSKNIFYLYLFLIVILLLTLALSQINVGITTNMGKFSYVIAIDNSDSMRANDLTPNRLEMSKTAAKDFINKLPAGIKVGIISFSGEITILSELDVSKNRLNNILDQITFSSSSGTNVNDAIIAANELLKKEIAKDMIILSDGQINIGNTSDMIDYAKENNLKIDTIALGTPAGGNTSLGFISKTDLDVLKALAFNTKGKFYSITDSKNKGFPFDEIINTAPGKVKVDISDYIIIVAIIFILIFWILYNFRFRNFP